MDTENLHYLRKYYSALYGNLILDKKLREKSTLISLFNIKSNTAYEILTRSAIPSKNVPRPFLRQLLSKGYIRETDTSGFTTITCKGVWEVETSERRLDLNKLLSNIDVKFFNVFKKEKPLTDKEKIIILSMISVRSFSEQSALDLKKDTTILTNLQDLIISAYRLLVKHKIITKLPEDKIFGAKVNEPPVSNLIRHAIDLKKKTRGIYKIIIPQKYYLDLYSETEISEDGLVFLFELILKNKPTNKLVKDIKNFCLENAYQRRAHLYENSQQIFTSPKYDDVIPEALERYYAKFTT